MLKKLIFTTLLALTPITLAVAGENIAKSFSQEFDLESPNLDLGDAELGFKLFNQNKEGRVHYIGQRESHIYDYIIVGNGTAGAALANKLTSNHNYKVLVIEAGANRSLDPIINTAAFDLNTITYDPRYAVTYTTPPFATAPTGQVYTYTEGRMWGGGSGHHYLSYVRGSPEIYDEWAAASGNSQWAYANILPTLKSLETYTSNGSPINLAERGTTGPVFSTQQTSILANPLTAAIQTAFNIPYVEDYNDATESAIGVSQRQLFVTPDNTTRSWAVSAYLAPGVVVDEDGKGLGGRKLTIVSNSFVNKIIWKGNTAVGVEFVEAGSEQKAVKVYAKKEIILAAGAINSPAILQRSGVGDQALLESLDIPVVFANSNVGANMKNHYGTIAYITGSTPQVLIGFTDMNPYMPSDGERRYQLFAQNVGGQVRVQGWNLNPQSTGNVQIVSKSALTQPKINFNFYSDGNFSTPGTDAYEAISFFKLAADTAAEIGATVTSPNSTQYASDALLFAAAQGGTVPPNLGNSLNFVITSHMVGTTRMGTSPANGVVDGNLNVMGVDNVKVIDIGVQPRIADGNTCVGAYVLGLKAYDIIIAGN